jgi:hypothetical protein
MISNDKNNDDIINKEVLTSTITIFILLKPLSVMYHWKNIEYARKKSA